MTRKDAISNIKIIGSALVDPVTKEQRELIDTTFNMAIAALSITEPCEDCISRENALNVLYKYGEEYFPLSTALKIENDIKNIPSVQPIRPKGEWIPKPYSIEWKSDAKCSNCGNLVPGALGNYVTCPYCSADMRGDNNE